MIGAESLTWGDGSTRKSACPTKAMRETRRSSIATSIATRPRMDEGDLNTWNIGEQGGF